VSNRVVDYTAPDGRKYKSLIPMTAPLSHASRGILIGPPDLKSLGLSPEMTIRLHNELFERDLVDYKSTRANLREVVSAIMHTFSVDAQAIVSLYYKNEGGE
jgi:hypothetical protein